MIDGSGTVTRAVHYGLVTASLSAPERFRSMLFDEGGDDDSGIIRMPVLKHTALHGSYYRSDRTFVAELALGGPFYHVPDWLYFRRDHPERAARAFTSVRDWCANLDPCRADRLRNPVLKLYGEYVWGFISAIQPRAAHRRRAARVLPAPRALGSQPRVLRARQLRLRHGKSLTHRPSRSTPSWQVRRAGFDDRQPP